MTIQERCYRFDDEDKVYLGNIITNFKGTEMYDLLLAVTTNIIMAELANQSDAKESSESQLGRLKGVRSVITAFDTYEAFRDMVMRAIKEKDSEVIPTEEPVIKSGGGAI